MGSEDFQFGIDHSHRPSFKKETTLPFQWRQNQTSIHVLTKILGLVGKAGTQPPGNRLLTPARSSQQLFLLDRYAEITCSLLWAQIKFLTHSPLFVGS